MHIKSGLHLAPCEDCLMASQTPGWSSTGAWVKNICLEWFSRKACFFFTRKTLKKTSSAYYYIMLQTPHLRKARCYMSWVPIPNKPPIKAAPCSAPWTFLEGCSSKKGISAWSRMENTFSNPIWKEKLPWEGPY